MGRRGPPRKPTKLKILQGTYRSDRAPENEPMPRQKVPSAPSWLGPDARREWRRVVKELDAVGLLTELDRSALGAYCQALQEYLDACRGLDAEREYIDRVRARRADERLLKKAAAGDLEGEDEIPYPETGLTAITSQGTRVIHPLVSIRNDAWRRLITAAREFGMTPASRTRIDVPTNANEVIENPFMKLAK